MRRLYDNQVYEIDTPTLAFVINRVGEYRIDVQPDGQATIVTGAATAAATPTAKAARASASRKASR